MVGVDIDGLPVGPRSPRIRLAPMDRRKLAEAAMSHPRSHPRARELEELSYRAEVLSLMGDSTEDDIDQALRKEARDLGLIKVDQHLWDPKLRAQRLAQIRVSAVSNITADSGASVTSAPALSRSPSTEASRSTTVTTPRTSHEKVDRLPELLEPDAPSLDLNQLEVGSPADGSRLNLTRVVRADGTREDSPSAEYQKFLSQSSDVRNRHFRKSRIPNSERAPSTSQSLFSSASRRSLASLKSSFSRFTRTTRAEPKLPIVTCSTCTVSWPAPTTTDLDCGHTQCHSCVRDIVLQAVRDKSKLPPSCCATVIPPTALKNVLTVEEQQRLSNAVLSLPTTSDDRFFCPNINLPEHLPLRNLKIDVRKPVEAFCEKCPLRICRTCKGGPHQPNEICPTDWPMLCINYLCDEQAWRRCHKCRQINELKAGESCVTCECKAKTCAKCSAVYDLLVGCPNMCNGEHANWEQRLVEMEARKKEEAKVKAKQAAEDDKRSLALLEATRRTQENQHLRRLRQQQLVERDRFVEFEDQQMRSLAKQHHAARLKVVFDNEQRENINDQKHAMASTVMEERHVAAEMSLQETLAQDKRACNIRLRHMEAYCHGRMGNGERSPRVVTETDLRELGRQYHLRDDMDRLHESKIGVLRTRQAKALEALLERQENAAEAERQKGEKALEELERTHLAEEGELNDTMRNRMERLVTRWEQQEAILRKKLEKQTGLTYGKMAEVPWPKGMGARGGGRGVGSKIWF